MYPHVTPQAQDVGQRFAIAAAAAEVEEKEAIRQAVELSSCDTWRGAWVHGRRLVDRKSVFQVEDMTRAVCERAVCVLCNFAVCMVPSCCVLFDALVLGDAMRRCLYSQATHAHEAVCLTAFAGCPPPLRLTQQDAQSSHRILVLSQLTTAHHCHLTLISPGPSGTCLVSHPSARRAARAHVSTAVIAVIAVTAVVAFLQRSQRVELPPLCLPHYSHAVAVVSALMSLVPSPSAAYTRFQHQGQTK